MKRWGDKLVLYLNYNSMAVVIIKKKKKGTQYLTFSGNYFLGHCQYGCMYSVLCLSRWPDESCFEEWHQWGLHQCQLCQRECILKGDRFAIRSVTVCAQSYFWSLNLPRNKKREFKEKEAGLSYVFLKTTDTVISYIRSCPHRLQRTEGVVEERG